MIKFLPILVIFLSAFALFAGVSNNPMVVWLPEQVAQDQFPGTVKVITAKFTSSKNLENVEFWITPKLSEYATVEPESIDEVEKDKEYTIQIIVSLPSDVKTKQRVEKNIEEMLGDNADKNDKDFLTQSPQNKIHGLLFVKSKKTLRPKPLRIVINIKEPTAEAIPIDEVSLPILEKIYEDPETGAIYVRDEVLIGFQEGTTEARIKEIVAEINGVFLGSIIDLDAYQVQVLNITDPSQLEQIIQQLENYPEVEIATYHWIKEVY